MRDARDFVIQVLTEWGTRDRLDDIRLCASELATNALLHGVPTGREYSVTVSWDDKVIRLSVRDSGGGTPAPRDPGSEECTGRGLLLVRAVADDLGVTEHTVGKSVWACFTTSSTPR